MRVSIEICRGVGVVRVRGDQSLHHGDEVFLFGPAQSSQSIPMRGAGGSLHSGEQPGPCRRQPADSGAAIRAIDAALDEVS
jgi:hypothetical protein